MSNVSLILAALMIVGPQRVSGRLPDEFSWSYGPPVLEARGVDGVQFISVKDPSIVRHGDKWHLFCTARGLKRTHAIVYSSFGDFGEANRAERHILSCH